MADLRYVHYLLRTTFSYNYFNLYAQPYYYINIYNAMLLLPNLQVMCFLLVALFRKISMRLPSL